MLSLGVGQRIYLGSGLLQGRDGVLGKGVAAGAAQMLAGPGHGGLIGGGGFHELGGEAPGHGAPEQLGGEVAGGCGGHHRLALADNTEVVDVRAPLGVGGHIVGTLNQARAGLDGISQGCRGVHGRGAHGPDKPIARAGASVVGLQVPLHPERPAVASVACGEGAHGAFVGRRGLQYRQHAIHLLARIRVLVLAQPLKSGAGRARKAGHGHDAQKVAHRFLVGDKAVEAERRGRGSRKQGIYGGGPGHDGLALPEDSAARRVDERKRPGKPQILVAVLVLGQRVRIAVGDVVQGHGQICLAEFAEVVFQPVGVQVALGFLPIIRQRRDQGGTTLVDLAFELIARWPRHGGGVQRVAVAKRVRVGQPALDVLVTEAPLGMGVGEPVDELAQRLMLGRAGLEGYGTAAGEHRRQVVAVDERLVRVTAAVVQRPDGVAERVPVVLALHHRGMGRVARRAAVHLGGAGIAALFQHRGDAEVAEHHLAF